MKQSGIRVRRIAVLWQAMSGYFDACLKQLSAADVSIALAYEGASNQAPFDDSQYGWVSAQYRWRGAPEAHEVRHLLEQARPDAVLISSWHLSAYRSVLRDLSGAGIPRVLCMDNQWRGRPKQWLGRLTWRQYIRPYYDLAFVPGDRQLAFARRLGFRREHVLRGLYCADTGGFARPPDLPGGTGYAFLYAGRLAREKGINVLAQAYTLYRESVAEPWPLRVAGTGPEVRSLRGKAGIELLGFQQPADLPQTMWDSSALICPSLFEPWGVVVHEACAAGLIVICSEEVGAGVHLVQDGYNGFVVRTGDPSDLARALLAVTQMSNERRREMSAASLSLSAQFSPHRWAAYVLEMLGWNTVSLEQKRG
jgi:glycosyltransferase involved in cell wall biosynthesis